MSSIPMEHGLLLAGILFALGLAGLLVRRDLIFTLIIFILATAAAEVSVGLALLLQLYHRYKSLDADAASLMRG